MLRLFNVVFAGFCFFLTLNVFGEVKPASIFRDHMVLQRDRRVPVWGWGEIGEDVTVSFGGTTVKTEVGKHGRWMVDLPPMSASKTPRTMIINHHVIRDILVGEVWVSAGQSNMEFGVSYGVNAQAEMAKGEDPEFRFVKVPHQSSGWPMDGVEVRWEMSTPKTVGGFDAVSTFLARELRRRLKVPVGIIIEIPN